MSFNNADNIIAVKGVTRIFRSVLKTPGFKGTMKMLFNPSYKTHTAIEDINFSMRSGEFVGLIGANGAGKTTLLKILSGLIPATTGEASVLGENPFDRSISLRMQLSLVMGQKAQLWWDLPASEAFELLRAIYQIPHDEFHARVKYFTELLQVDRLLQTQIRRLSLGERMKMEIIGALLHKPKILFLDEPTIGLDVVAAKNLRDFLREYNQTEGTTIILTSHNMDDISELCKRILIIKEGKMIYDGDPQGLVSQDECRLKIQIDPTKHTELQVSNVVDLLNIEPKKIQKDEEQLSTFHIQTKRQDMAALLQSVLSKYSILEIGIDEPDLESVIQKIYLKKS